MNPERPLGAVLAGGRGRRIGGDKAAVGVGGVALAERAARILEVVVEPVLLSTDDEDLAVRLERPRVGDRRPDGGPLAGLESALLEARDRERPGVLVLACDLPLVRSEVLEAVLEVSARPGDPRAVLPESPGPLGIEPLCGLYALSSLAAIQEALDAGRRSVRGLLDRLEVRTVPARRFAGAEPPEVLFHNVNTPEARERAETLLAGRDR